MTDIAFYHLTASDAADALPQLINKTLAAGKKALVSSSQSHIATLSTALWSHGHTAPAQGRPSYGGQGSWLPHGIAGKDEDDAALCPIWFSGEFQDNPIAAEFSFYLDGMTPQNAGGFDRIFILFNGLDDAAVTTARTQWKSLREEGHDLSYWTQDDSGAWKKTA